MTPLGSIALIAGLLIAIGGLLWYLLITTEGVYLGRRVIIWLYDVYARRYDRIKKYDRDWEVITLGGPVLDALCDIATPLILDVATGTARLPLCLLDEPDFDGQIVGLDYSRRMLGVDGEKLAALPTYNSHSHLPVTLIHTRAEALPFDDGTFDAVICLEALEFMMNQDVVLAEIVRVARPGALILLTNRKGSGAWLMPFKTQKAEALATRLRERYGLIDVHIQIWQVDYEQVWAFKPGDLEPALDRTSGVTQTENEILNTVETILRCPRCQQHRLRRVEGRMHCQNCQTGIQIGSDGVVEYEAWIAFPKTAVKS